jgi:putative transposase
MARKKKHSAREIAAKLEQADALEKDGKLQSEIARTLGVSVMTLHRWRKAAAGPQHAPLATRDASQPERAATKSDRLAELQVENSRLRRLVTDLLLERMKLEEAGQNSRSASAAPDIPRRMRPART